LKISSQRLPRKRLRLQMLKGFKQERKKLMDRKLLLRHS
jgi:hypothetical protein